ncbi:hypothetical protein TNCV_332881 [Trichonephila clavipes]|nr:hypothetical protein TNCV_332881 [Trichonephila clavipes]
MEAEHAFQVYLIQYQGVHLSDYITFMTQFRIIVNGLQPPEIIDLHTDTEQRIGELLTKVLPDHHSLDILRVRDFARSEPKDVSSDYVEQEASKGKGAFIQALWTLYAKSSLYRLADKAWKRHGPQNLTTWTLLAQAVLDGCYAEKWPDTMFQVPDGTQPIENILETVMSPRKMGELERSIALDQFSHFLGCSRRQVGFKAYWEAQELSRHQGRKLKE